MASAARQTWCKMEEKVARTLKNCKALKSNAMWCLAPLSKANFIVVIKTFRTMSI